MLMRTFNSSTQQTEAGGSQRTVRVTQKTLGSQGTKQKQDNRWALAQNWPNFQKENDLIFRLTGSLFHRC